MPGGNTCRQDGTQWLLEESFPQAFILAPLQLQVGIDIANSYALMGGCAEAPTT